MGKFEIKCDGKPVIISSRIAQSLFAYLILTAGTLHRREKLAGMFWPEATEEKARAYLRHEIWRIRKALSPKSEIDYLLSDDINLSFNSSVECWLDVTTLTKVSESALTGELINALSVVQGELLPGFYDDWVMLEREHLHAIFEQKMTRLVEILETEKRWTDILEWAERWISLGQAPEAAYRYLMIAYDGLGDHAKVAATYERCVQALRVLDLEPSEETRAVAFKRTPKLNIPIPLTSFIGRKKELKEVADLFSKSRLVTLTGSGGVGKTRLAIQVVADVLDCFPDGVWFLDLAPLSDPALMPNTLAGILGLRESGELPIIDLLINYFRSRTALVIFDNCEHLIESCAQLVHSLLTSCEKLSILATSRETLGVSGEVPYRVPSLEVPNIGLEFAIDELSNMESVRLFMERAALVSSSFVINSNNVLAIAQICLRLDGIPLAIELAAARVNVLADEQILKYLDDRFNLLTNGWRSVLPRHRTLRATIEWSYELLTEKERVLFRRLSVFSGGWTLEGAKDICTGSDIASSEMLELLSQLVNKSLITAQASQSGMRYHMLETLRQYANERLIASQESDLLRDKHLKFFLKLAETAEPHLIRPEQVDWFPLLDADYENLSIALERALSKELAEPSLRLCTAISWYWAIRYYWSEGLNWLTRALAIRVDNTSHSEKVARVRVLYAQAFFERELGNFEQSLPPAEASFALALEVSDKRDIAIARFAVGFALRLRGEVDDQARALMEQSFAEFQELDDLFWQAQTFPRLGFLLSRQGKSKIQDVCLISIELARKAGERMTLVWALSEYAYILFCNNRTDEATQYAEESDTAYEQLASKNIGLNSSLFADIAWLDGNYQKAKSLYMEMQERNSLFGMRSETSFSVAALGLLAMEEGDLNQAQTYLKQALRIAREVKWQLSIAFRLVELSNLFYLQGDRQLFKQNFRESLFLKNYLSESQIVYILMTILGSLYCPEPEISVQLLGVIDHYLETEYPYFSPVEKRYCRRADAHAREALGIAAFVSAFAEGQKMSLDEGLDLALKAVEEM